MNPTTLRADCARCAALCCVALAFDRSRHFAFDKPAGAPCRHLDGASRCAVHARRLEAGMSGCVGYDCRGAGQYVTQTVFGGRSWRTEPELLRPMIGAFSTMREILGLAVLLHAVEWLPPLGAERRKTARALLQRLLPAPGWSRMELAGDRPIAAAKAARAFLLSLREAAPGGMLTSPGEAGRPGRVSRRASG